MSSPFIEPLQKPRMISDSDLCIKRASNIITSILVVALLIYIFNACYAGPINNRYGRPSIWEAFRMRPSTAAMYAVEDQPGKTYRPSYGRASLTPHTDPFPDGATDAQLFGLADPKETFGAFRKASKHDVSKKTQKEFFDEFESLDRIDKPVNGIPSHKPEHSEEQLMDILNL